MSETRTHLNTSFGPEGSPLLEFLKRKKELAKTAEYETPPDTSIQQANIADERARVFRIDEELRTREPEILGESPDGGKTIKLGDGSVWKVEADGSQWLIASSDGKGLRYDDPNSPPFYDE